VTSWLARVAAQAVPAEWRESVQDDLQEEAAAERRGDLWMAYQTARVALRYRWTFRGDALLSDVRYAVRALLAAKWFTAGAMATFALGIGINVAVFCAVDRLLFRSLPYGHPESLVLLRSCEIDSTDCVGSFPAAVAFQLSQHSETMADVSVAGFPQMYRVSRGPSDDPIVSLIAVSPGALRALGVTPLLGRDISDVEIASKSPVAWISEEAWQRRFGSEAGILQRILWSRYEGVPVPVVGVLPRGFVPPSIGQDPEWAGLVVEHGGDGWAAIRQTGRLAVPFARLKPGVSVAQAQAEVDAIVNSLPLEPRQQTRERLRVDRIDASLFAYYRNYLWLIVTAAGLVLVMACSNLASLFLARGRSRQQLAAVCTALGASSGRLVSAALIEALLVCLAGVAGALVVLAAVQKATLLFLPPLFSRYAAGLTDLRVIGFSLVVTVICAIVAGTLPGWRATRLEILPLLQRGTRSGRRARVHGGRGLLVFEAAVGAVLVLGAVLAGRTLLALTYEDLGFQPEGLYLVNATGGVMPADPRDPAQRMAAQQQGVQQLVDAMRRLPGAAAAGAGDYNPASHAAPMRAFASDVQAGPRVQVTPGYMEAVGVRLVAGRTFTDEDVSSRAPVAMMNRSGARLVWPGTEPAQIVGRVWTPTGETPRRVIGIVEDMKFGYGAEAFEPIAYVPVGTEVTGWGTISVRMHPGQALPLPALRTFIAERLPNARINSVAHAAEGMSPVLRDPRFRATLLGGFALTALLLAGVGLYAVASYEAAQRRYEMGVRLTLGATPTALRRLILREAAAPVLIGGLIGLVGAWWIAGVGQSFLYRTDARDLTLYVPVLVVLVGTAALAAWTPARRAARTDPAIVLRAQ
jgi:predicted permease